MAVEVSQNLTQVTISSAGVAGVSGTSGTSGFSIDSGSFLTTSSFNTFTSSYSVDSASFASRINAATNEQDLSYFTITSSFNEFTSSIQSEVNSIKAWTASLELINTIDAELLELYQTTASLNSKTGSYATTGSNTFSGNQTINGSITLENGAVIKDNASDSVSFGYLAGLTNQGTQSVAIGNGAGYSEQSHGSVAVGVNAGAINQGQRAVALGSLAGTSNQGEAAIAIGNFAAPNNQGANSIVISAVGSALENTIPNSLVIAPIRNVNGNDGVLQYNTTTNEVSYETTLNGITNLATTGSNQFSGSQEITGSVKITGSVTIDNIDSAWTFREDGVLKLNDGIAEIYADVNEYSLRIGTAAENVAPNTQIILGGSQSFKIKSGPPLRQWDFDSINGDFNLTGSINGARNLPTTGSNTFVGNQTVSGSLMISGSGSLNGDNIVSSNTIMKIETISSASYAALNPPVSGTLYIII